MTVRKTPAEARIFASDHLLYDIEMVAGLVERLRRHRVLLETTPRSAGALANELFDLAGRNADIEAFGVHARALVDFLYGSPRHEDAVAADFFDDAAAWRRLRPKKPAALSNINARVGAEIAHLSFRRSAPAKTWPYEAIWRALADVLRVFVENATVGRIGAEAQDRAREVLALREPDPVRGLEMARSGATEYQAAVSTVEPSGGTAIYPLDREPHTFE